MSASDTLAPMSEPFVVELPAAIRPLLEAEAREHGFESVADYIAALVRANSPVEAEDPELETALLDGLDSGESRQESPMSATDRIVIDPTVMLGKPVIRGTRIPVELIVRKMGEGATEADLLDAYPALTSADIRAALSYAADALAHDETILLP